MTGLEHVIPYLVVIALLAYRILRRSRRRSTDTPRLRLWARAAGAAAPGVPQGPGRVRGAVALVAEREVRQRLRGRVFRVGTLVLFAAVAAAIVVPTLDRSGTDVQQVGVVGSLAGPTEATVISGASALGITVHLVPEPDLDAARTAVRSGALDLAIIDADQVLVNRAIAADDGSSTAQVVGTVSATLGHFSALQAAGLTPAQVAQAARATAAPIVALEPARAAAPVHGTSTVLTVLTFLLLTQYLTWTLMGVMEEKASRVAEVLLAAVRPAQLLTGKVLGIGLVVLGQAALLTGFGLGLAAATGSNLLHGVGPAAVLSSLLWIVLGYAFLCWVYAAAGSTAQRQDQVQSLALPLTIPLLVGYVGTLTAAGSGHASTFVKVLAYLPPTAPFAMPVLVGLHAVAWWQFAAAVLISLLATVAVAGLATVVYRRSVLRTGQRTKLRDVAFRSMRRNSA